MMTTTSRVTKLPQQQSQNFEEQKKMLNDDDAGQIGQDFEEETTNIRHLGLGSAQNLQDLNGKNSMISPFLFNYPQRANSRVGKSN